MDIGKPISSYLYTKRNVTKHILLTALFALVFIVIFEPFGLRESLGDISDLLFLGVTTLMVILGMAVVAISRVILYHRCNAKHGGHDLSLGWYAVWIAAEVFFMSAAFVLLEIFWLKDSRSITDLMKTAFSNTALVLLLPYSLLWLYFSWDDKDKKLKQMAEHGFAEATEQDNKNMIHFRDSKGDVKLSLKQADILYIKGADNYIYVFYSDNQKMSQAMVRITIKAVEEQLATTRILRCHRSYLVNTKRIKILEKQKDGFLVKLEAPGVDQVLVPVSKNYVEDPYSLFS